MQAIGYIAYWEPGMTGKITTGVAKDKPNPRKYATWARISSTALIQSNTRAKKVMTGKQGCVQASLSLVMLNKDRQGQICPSSDRNH